VVVALGKVPSEHLLGRSVAVTNEAGSVHDARIADASRRVLVCVHPAATLYDPGQRGPFESALGAAVDLVEGGGTNRASASSEPLSGWKPTLRAADEVDV